MFILFEIYIQYFHSNAQSDENNKLRNNVNFLMGKMRQFATGFNKMREAVHTLEEKESTSRRQRDSQQTQRIKAAKRTQKEEHDFQAVLNRTISKNWPIEFNPSAQMTDNMDLDLKPFMDEIADKNVGDLIHIKVHSTWMKRMLNGIRDMQPGILSRDADGELVNFSFKQHRGDSHLFDVKFEMGVSTKNVLPFSDSFVVGAERVDNSNIVRFAIGFTVCRTKGYYLHSLMNWIPMNTVKKLYKSQILCVLECKDAAQNQMLSSLIRTEEYEIAQFISKNKQK